MVKSNLFERFLTFLDCVTDDLNTYLQKIVTENVGFKIAYFLLYRKCRLKCWCPVPVCVKLGRNTEKQTEKEGEV